MDSVLATTAWYSPSWLFPPALSQFDWVNSFWLYLIPTIPAIFALRWLINLKFGRKLHVAFSKSEIRSSPITYLRFIPPMLFALALTMVMIALARPQKSSETIEQWSEGIDIMLAIDISQSMEIEDFKPNRLEAAKDVAEEFISGRFRDRIGIVIFSGDAYSLTPLTTDYDLLRENIDEIDFDMIQKSGTAIGSAIGVSTNRMRESDAKSKVIILLSDGDNTAGNIDPITAAKLAEAYGIKIYTIGIGKNGRVPWGKDFFGRPRYVESYLNEKTLKEIAEIGHGQFFRATNNKALEEIFDRIDNYEKVKIKENKYKNTEDFYSIYLKWAIVFFLAWLATKLTFINNILED
ncbi:vWA domain-containing protein [Aureibacter tunicatorum]|uniref:Ca-activated chloride channel family protein n=1 Tax=Aureibacter tunicatorum TaxID=866807 RepID=A0AAE3XT87_9BACT|nr:VWA domain-containing protein [Aureibacter tunicatorum]MDR6241219.1 Ca-activated chloride channel family protein [Aureibacter tunicatorum]BDD03480.1 aerotolerance protein BatA [Aureibacter tunicatorum]